MLFVETDFAIYKRLVGYPVDDKGRPMVDTLGVPTNREVIGPPNYNFDGSPPLLPSYGIRLPTMPAPHRAQRGLTSRDPDAVRQFLAGFDPLSFRQVPVFDQNISGRKVDDLWPCVTFRLNGARFDPSVHVYDDPFMVPDPSSASVTIMNQWGDTIDTGRVGALIRPHPESYVATYVITGHSKNLTEMNLILGQILYLFPARGGLTITLQDGSTHTCDMLLQRIVNLKGDEEALLTLDLDEEREQSWACIYEVETYLDNSTNQFGVQDIYARPVVVQRILELDDIQGRMIEQPYDMNTRETA